MAVKKTYSQIFASAVLVVVEMLEAKLGRKLDIHEVNGLCNTSTLIMLESVERNIYQSNNRNELEDILKALTQSRIRIDDAIELTKKELHQNNIQLKEA